MRLREWRGGKGERCGDAGTMRRRGSSFIPYQAMRQCGDDAGVEARGARAGSRRQARAGGKRERRGRETRRVRDLGF
jgi:hypothetical protein